MKLVNEKGKLFGIINPVDLLILIAILLAVAAVGYKFLAAPVTEAVIPEKEATVVMRIRGAMPYLTEEIKTKVVEGEKLIAGNDYINGTVKSIEVIPYVVTVTTADGQLKEATDPIKSDILVTVTSKGNPDAPIFKIGNQEVRAGRGFTFKTSRVEVEAIVDSVNFNG